jgi:hypothetical protein
LIIEYKERKDRFSNTIENHVSIWKEIAASLQIQHHPYDWKKCQWKFRRMKQKYHEVIQNTRKTGSSAIHFRHFEIFNEMFKKSHSTNPQALASSLVYTQISKNHNADEDLDTPIATPNHSQAPSTSYAKASVIKKTTISIEKPTGTPSTNLGAATSKAKTKALKRTTPVVTVLGANNEAPTFTDDPNVLDGPTKGRKSIREGLEQKIDEMRKERAQRHLELMKLKEKQIKLQEEQLAVQKASLKKISESMKLIVSKLMSPSDE